MPDKLFDESVVLGSTEQASLEIVFLACICMAILYIPRFRSCELITKNTWRRRSCRRHWCSRLRRRSSQRPGQQQQQQQQESRSQLHRENFVFPKLIFREIRRVFSPGLGLQMLLSHSLLDPPPLLPTALLLLPLMCSLSPNFLFSPFLGEISMVRDSPG